MASFVKFHCFIEDVFEEVHNFSSDTFKIALSNTAPTVATDDEFTDITEISSGNGYTAGGESLTITSSSQTSGTYSWVITSDVVWTATGSVGPFRYVILYNDSATNDELIGYWDYGSEVTLATSDIFTAKTGGTTVISAS